jgi:hypothetical protein
LATPSILEEEWPVIPEGYDLAKTFVTLAEELLEQRKIKPHPAAVRDDGLEAILAVLENLKQEKVSGEKLVYIITFYQHRNCLENRY